MNLSGMSASSLIVEFYIFDCGLLGTENNVLAFDLLCVYDIVGVYCLHVMGHNQSNSNYKGLHQSSKRSQTKDRKIFLVSQTKIPIEKLQNRPEDVSNNERKIINISLCRLFLNFPRWPSLAMAWIDQTIDQRSAALSFSALYNILQETYFEFSPEYIEQFHIFVGDLSSEIETQQLREAFAPFGEVSIFVENKTERYTHIYIRKIPKRHIVLFIALVCKS
uniref:RRM domain-containing protein n=1 Tax=Glossina brevipalpis TaxID=37001 RepID=A0A1A9X4Q0_9MUSC